MDTSTAKKEIVSIVIPAYNEELTIRWCLKSLTKQDYKNIEVIIIDDLSSDKTSLIAKQWARKLNLKFIIVRNKKHCERSASRNLGARLSKGSYLLFLDSDMQVSKRAISECVSLISGSSEVKAIIIPEESFGKGFWSKCKSLEKRCYIGDDRMEAARFFESKAFWQVGGWDDKMISGEDWDLTYRTRSRFKVSRIRSLLYHDEHNLTLWKAIKKKFYYASAIGIYLEKNPLSFLTIIFFIFRPSFIRNWKLLISDPLHGIGMLFLKAMELSAGLVGYFASKFLNRPQVFS